MDCMANWSDAFNNRVGARPGDVWTIALYCKIKYCVISVAATVVNRP